MATLLAAGGEGGVELGESCVAFLCAAGESCLI